MTEKQQQQRRARLAEGFYRAIPHNQALDVSIVETGTGVAEARLDYRRDFLGDPEAGLWHTGPAIALADATCGLAVLLALSAVESIATLDLRMDYLRPAVAGEPLTARAECYHLTSRMAFVRATVHQGDIGTPTAICTAAFMRTSRDKSGQGGAR